MREIGHDRVLIAVLEDESVTGVGDRIGFAVAILVIARVVIADVREADGVTDFVGQRGLAIATVIQVEIIPLILVDEHVALNFLLLAVPASVKRRESGSLTGSAVGVHEADVGSALAILLDELRGNQVIPQLK